MLTVSLIGALAPSVTLTSAVWWTWNPFVRNFAWFPCTCRTAVVRWLTYLLPCPLCGVAWSLLSGGTFLSACLVTLMLISIMRAATEPPRSCCIFGPWVWISSPPILPPPGGIAAWIMLFATLLWSTCAGLSVTPPLVGGRSLKFAVTFRQLCQSITLCCCMSFSCLRPCLSLRIPTVLSVA